MMLPVGARIQRARRALYVTRVARHAGIRRVLAEIGVRGDREATREGARAFREALEELGTTYIKLGQLLSSRPDLLPDVYIEELGHLVHQVTIEGVYHADPHRGNVLLTADGQLALLDFGLLGRLDQDSRRGLSLLLLAIAQNRADDVADLILSLSLTTVQSDQPAFFHDVRRKLPRFHWRPLSGIRAGEALADLQRIALQQGIRLPTSFALVGKTLAQADEIARTLSPELDPIALLESDAIEVMLIEAERRLEPN